MKLCVLLFLLMPLAASAAETNASPAAVKAPAASANAAPVEAKPPTINVAAPSFPNELAVQERRGPGDFLYDVGVASVVFLFNLVLLAIGSIWIARKIEKYKSQETLRVELSKERAKEIDKLSRLLFELEYAIEMKGNALGEFDRKEQEENREHDHTAWVKLFREQSWPVEDLKKRVSKEIEATQFWLGPKRFARFMAHFDQLEQYDGLLETRKWTEAKELWEKINAGRPSVLDIIKNPED